VLELVAGLESVAMARYAVVGSYTRFEERVREGLRDARARIGAGFGSSGRRENHLLWAAPGSGKTYFVEQIAAADPAVSYRELNLAKLDEVAFREGLEAVVSGGRPVLCLVDEVDAKPETSWPYELLMPCLDANLGERGGGLVFVLAGSSGASLEEFRQRIAGRPKGADMLSRIPEANSCVIAPMGAGDQVLVAVSQMLNAAAETGRSVTAVEKLALYYIASTPQLANARQLREFAVRAVGRGSPADERVRYDDLFDAGDPDNKAFWVEAMPAAEALVGSFVSLNAERVPTRAAPARTTPPSPPEATLVAQPTGTVTLLFTDVEGSTRLLEQLGTGRYAEALEQHRRLLRDAFARHGGYEFGTEGDAFFVAFASAPDAAAAALEAQQALAAAEWPDGVELRVRIGLHTGNPQPAAANYVGIDLHRVARIMSAGHGGQVLVSSTTAALLDGTSLRDLGPHRLKDLLEPIRLYQLEIDGLPGEFPPLRSLHQTNLPLAAWPLLGRERELAKIRSLVAEGARLLTLTGPGGSGKTRLALQAAAELSDAFSDGVFFVALAPLRDTLAVRSTVAEAVGLQPDDDVAAWLTPRRVLLVLDNLEQLPGVQAVAAELLVGETTIVATSRTPLRLSGERELPVEPLPDEAAVELFVSRAAAAGRDLAADETVAAVCRRLDNLPLALELAAARAKLLSPAALLQRLDTALPLLTGGAHDLPERQRTLRATIEWSHDLLDPDAQAAFRRLSVFRGSFTLDTAEAISGADLDQIATLLDQSLLKPRGDDRFFMLETLREYAREQLDQAGESDEYALRHARYYLARLEHDDPAWGARRVELQAWFAAEEDNLRAMLDRLSADGEKVVDAAHAAKLLDKYWYSRGSRAEQRQRLLALLGRDELPNTSRAVLLRCLAWVEYSVGDLNAFEAAAREALPLTQPRTHDHADVLHLLGNAAVRSGRSEEAVRYAHQIQQEAADPSASITEVHRVELRANAANILGEAGDTHAARALTREVQAEFHALGNEYSEAATATTLAQLDLYEHDYQAARDRFVLTLATARRLEASDIETEALRDLGYALLGLQRHNEARATFLELLDLALQDSPTATLPLADALAGIALAANPQDTARAARLRAATASIRHTATLANSPRTTELERHFEQPLIDALGQDVWEREQAADAALTFEETIMLARSLA
jgi:predicted ATPase/class 3 adenylate cyclase